MYVQHARSPRRHLQPISQPRRPRARQRRPRRITAILESREEIMYTRDYESPRNARRGHLLLRLEPRWQMGSQRRWRRSSQGFCTVIFSLSLGWMHGIIMVYERKGPLGLLYNWHACC